VALLRLSQRLVQAGTRRSGLQTGMLLVIDAAAPRNDGVPAAADGYLPYTCVCDDLLEVVKARATRMTFVDGANVLHRGAERSLQRSTSRRFWMRLGRAQAESKGLIRYERRGRAVARRCLEPPARAPARLRAKSLAVRDGAGLQPHLRPHPSVVKDRLNAAVMSSWRGADEDARGEDSEVQPYCLSVDHHRDQVDDRENAPVAR
jgi:hypothetical protein